MFSVIYL